MKIIKLILLRTGLRLGFLFQLIISFYYVSAQTVINNGLTRFKFIRYEENYDDFKVTDSTKVIEKLKHLQFGKSNSYVSFGGELRLAYERTQNPLFGLIKGADKIGLLRTYIHADNHIGKNFRIYAQLASGLKQWGLTEPISIQQDLLFVHQAFLEYNFSNKPDKKIILRVGRQELQVGSGRILSARIGPNIRQSYDVARIILHGFSKWNFSAFYGRPVFNELGVFDNKVLDSRSPDFWNLATTRNFKNFNTDIYYFGFKNNNAVFNRGFGKEVRHSIGGRIYGRKKFDFDVEALYQFGTFNDAYINAYTASANIGYSFDKLMFKPRIGLKLDYISGDQKPSSKNFQTFNAMFPDGGYFAGVQALGPSNLFDINPSIEYQFDKNFRLSTGAAFVWRASLADGLYNPGGFILVKETGANTNRYVGAQFTQTARYELNRYFSILIIYAHFFAGDYLKESTNPSRTSTDFFSLMTTFQF